MSDAETRGVTQTTEPTGRPGLPVVVRRLSAPLSQGFLIGDQTPVPRRSSTGSLRVDIRCRLLRWRFVQAVRMCEIEAGTA